MQSAGMHFTVIPCDELLKILDISRMFSYVRLPRNSGLSQHELQVRPVPECGRSLSTVPEKKHCYSNGFFSNYKSISFLIN